MRRLAVDRGTVAIHVGDHDAAARQAELLRLLVVDVLRQDADPAADHAAVIEDILHDAAGQIDRDREADALDAHVAAVALVEHRRVDADQFAARIDQRAAGVAGVDRGIGLNEILEGRDARADCGRWR